MTRSRRARHEAKPALSNAWYDALKFIALVVLPGLGALYFGLTKLWDLPYGVEVVGTIALVDVFLGEVIRRANAVYQRSDARFDGSLVPIESNEEKDVYTIESSNMRTLAEKDSITLKVQPPA